MMPVAKLGPLLVTTRVNCIGSPISTRASSTRLDERQVGRRHQQVGVGRTVVDGQRVGDADARSDSRRVDQQSGRRRIDGAARAKSNLAAGRKRRPARRRDRQSPRGRRCRPGTPWQAQTRRTISAGRLSVTSVPGRRSVRVGHRDQVDGRGSRHGFGDAVGLVTARFATGVSGRCRWRCCRRCSSCRQAWRS